MKYNFDTKSFFEKRNICLNEVEELNFNIKISLIDELVYEILDKTKDYSVLYNLAKVSKPSRLGILGYIMTHSSNISEALEKLCKYYLLIGNRIKPIFTKAEDKYKIVLYINDQNGNIIDKNDYKTILHIFAIIHLINYIISKKVKPTLITFKQKKIHYSLSNNEIDGIKINFGEEENAIYFNNDIEDIKTTSSNKQLLKVFEREAEETLHLKLDNNILKEKIAGLILVSSTETDIALDISLDSISSKAKMHPRVLQSKLKEEGTSFSKILLDVRKKLSIYYLSRDIDITTISLSLGYIDLSSFFRAFKKWYKMTPRQWKERNK